MELRIALDLAERTTVFPEQRDHADGLAAALRKKGLNFPAMDLVIASVAASEKMRLLTTRGDVPRIVQRQHRADCGEEKIPRNAFTTECCASELKPPKNKSIDEPGDFF